MSGKKAGLAGAAPRGGRPEHSCRSRVGCPGTVHGRGWRARFGGSPSSPWGSGNGKTGRTNPITLRGQVGSIQDSLGTCFSQIGAEAVVPLRGGFRNHSQNVTGSSWFQFLLGKQSRCNTWRQCIKRGPWAFLVAGP